MSKISKKEKEKALEVVKKMEMGDPEILGRWKEAQQNRDFVMALERNGGDVMKAVRSLNPGWRQWDDDKVRAKGIELLRREGVGEAIREALNSFKVTPMRVIGMLERIATNADRDSDRLKALEMLGKWCNIFNETKTQNVTNNLHISEDAAVRLLERRGSHVIDRGRFVDASGETSSVIDGEEESG